MTSLAKSLPSSYLLIWICSYSCNPLGLNSCRLQRTHTKTILYYHRRMFCTFTFETQRWASRRHPQRPSRRRWQPLTAKFRLRNIGRCSRSSAAATTGLSRASSCPETKSCSRWRRPPTTSRMIRWRTWDQNSKIVVWIRSYISN